MRYQNKHNLRSVIRKILAAFLLVSVAISLALAIARFSFRELLGTVEELSRPNEKLTRLSNLFEEITTLDQVQRAEALENPHKPYNTFINQSVTLNAMIDSLKILPWDTAQLHRLEEMKTILSDRDKLFFSYLKVKAELQDNREFSVQLDTLAAILQNDELAIDSSIITTQKKTTTTYLRDSTPLPKSEQRSLIKKLFSRKKKNPVDTPLIKVQEELSVMVDTLAYARQNDAIREIEKIMRDIELDQRNQRKKLQRQELELIHANSQFINRLLNILHDVENEELQQMRATNGHAVTVMNQSISRINIIMLVFFVAAALLVYLIWIDISKSNYYKEQLEQARDEAEQLTKIKQRFLANMSHEIRTPLQSIIGFAEQLKQKSNSPQEEVDAIYSSSEHLLQIVNEVLDYSRIASGNLTLAHEKFRLTALVKEVESAMRIQAERKKLTFVLDNEKTSDFTILGDPFRLRQVLYNVIGNAIKFTHRGFIKLSVKTSDEGQHIFCTFEVTDTGIGIEKEEVEKIFNQFEQANTSITKHYGGTGLGLTIVKSLVTAMDGTLELNSEPGIGTSFRIKLRFEKAPASSLDKIQLIKPSAPAFRGKVMVIDDDTLILRLCSLILKKNNVEFVTFSHALTLLQQPADPAVTHIFLDIRMPEINGIELCRALRKIYRTSTRFIALTAHVLPEERENLLAEGFDAVLAKPFHESELLNIIGITPRKKESIAEELPNLSLLKNMTMGDEVLFQSIITQFIEETLDDLIRMKESLSDENARALREVVHKMAGRFAQLGMRSLAEKLHSLEKLLVAGATIAEVADETTPVMEKVDEMVIQIRLTAMEQLN
jgi:signal transduction histidine kinase/DNA-binding NarL/FixJ family response regulator